MESYASNKASIVRPLQGRNFPVADSTHGETQATCIILNQLTRIWQQKKLALFLKRCIDLLLSTTGLIIAAPLMIVAALAIKLESPGPIIYRQKRLGWRNKLFTIYKFRSMVDGAEKGGPRWAARQDKRITRVGRILRRGKIDELPQLWNVLRGEMSLIGPRPERMYFVKRFRREDPRFAWRTVVKPGITGWAQVNGGYDLGPIEKLELDLAYIEHFTLLMDLKILWLTISVVLHGKGVR